MGFAEGCGFLSFVQFNPFKFKRPNNEFWLICLSTELVPSPVSFGTVSTKNKTVQEFKTFKTNDIKPLVTISQADTKLENWS